MAAPGTSWRSSTKTSVAVDISVDGRTRQQVVLFDGAQPFTYEAFVGGLTTGVHCVAITVDPARSSDLATPRITIYKAALGVVPRSSPAFALLVHAPVMFGRTTSASRNAQILTYGQVAPDADGRDTDLSYTVIWTREDVGDGVIPAYEWGLFGRMTDIETVLHERVTPSGRVRSATYLSCGCEHIPVFPDVAPAPPVDSEIDKPYPTTGALPRFGHHLELRDATGNNDVSPAGTTAYRFQQVPVAGPAADDSREVAMDDNPWTYRISEQEVARSTAQSTSASSILAGHYSQYLIVDINATATGTKSIAIGVKLAGSATWFTNDYAQLTSPETPTTFPFYNGGHARTVIKVPLGMSTTTVTALRLVLNSPPGKPLGKLVGHPRITLVALTPTYRIRHPSVPKPTVITGTQLLPDLPT